MPGIKLCFTYISAILLHSNRKNILKEIVSSNSVRKEIKKEKAGAVSASWPRRKDALKIENYLV